MITARTQDLSNPQLMSPRIQVLRNNNLGFIFWHSLIMPIDYFEASISRNTHFLLRNATSAANAFLRDSIITNRHRGESDDELMYINTISDVL